MIGGDCIKGEPGCTMSGGGEAGPAGWTGLNKTLLQQKSALPVQRFNQVPATVKVEKLCFRTYRTRHSYDLQPVIRTPGAYQKSCHHQDSIMTMTCTQKCTIGIQPMCACTYGSGYFTKHFQFVKKVCSKFRFQQSCHALTAPRSLCHFSHVPAVLYNVQGCACQRCQTDIEQGKENQHQLNVDIFCPVHRQILRPKKQPCLMRLFYNKRPVSVSSPTQNQPEPFPVLQMTIGSNSHVKCTHINNCNYFTVSPRTHISPFFKSQQPPSQPVQGGTVPSVQKGAGQTGAHGCSLCPCKRTGGTAGPHQMQTLFCYSYKPLLQPKHQHAI